MGNTLKHAQIDINDNFYTRYEDIEAELKYYHWYLKDKIILCNFDDPSYSNFWKYFLNNFDRIQPKKVICTHINNNGPSFALIKSPTNLLTIPLKGNGDFQSEECLKYFYEADVIITNPAFSKAKDLIKLCVRYSKKYLLITNKNIITQHDVFLEFMNDKLFMGYNDVKWFYGDSGKDRPNDQLINFGNIGWMTNIITSKKPKQLPLNVRYSKDKYPKFDNYDAICVDKIRDIPGDYAGVMAVPISFIDYYDPKKYKIIGMDINPIAKLIGIDQIGEEWINKYHEQGGKAHYSKNMRCLVYIDKKTNKAIVKYRRILIQNISCIKNYD